MNRDLQIRMSMSQLRVEKVTLDNHIQKAVRASERLARYDEELSETQAEIMAYRKTYGKDPVHYDANGRVSKTRPRDKDGIEIPVPLSEKLYDWFSGRR